MTQFYKIKTVLNQKHNPTTCIKKPSAKTSGSFPFLYDYQFLIKFFSFTQSYLQHSFGLAVKIPRLISLNDSLSVQNDPLEIL